MIRIAAACLLVIILVPASAGADGDPASDVLLGENVFYPYSPPVSASLQRALNSETAAAARGHFAIKVALISSTADLGVITSLFDRPQKYADFLDQEISFQGKQPLLVVMPTGYGVQEVSPPTRAAAAALTKPPGIHGDDLARAAIAAVSKLAAAAGHPIADIPNAPSSATGTGSATVIVILAVGAVATAAAHREPKEAPARQVKARAVGYELRSAADRERAEAVPDPVRASAGRDQGPEAHPATAMGAWDPAWALR